MPSLSDVTIRPARHQDISALTGMARALAESVGLPAAKTDKDALAQLLFGGDRWAEAHVAVDAREQQLIGYLTLSRRFEPHSGARSLWLGDFYVMRAARRQGVGTALLHAAVKRALALKCEALVWRIAGDNEVGRAFFKATCGAPDNESMPWRLVGDDLRDFV